jgi:S-DNA-T family DNA segregation ATPase FtsK/SpoIIIE
MPMTVPGAGAERSVPELPQGEIQLPSPPELPEVAADGLTQVLMYLPMGAMAIGMVAVLAGGKSSPVLFIGSGAMAVGMAGMMAGQLARGKGDRKLKINGQRRDFLRYLSQIRRRVRRAAEQQRQALEYRGPAPRSLPSLLVAGAGQIWQRAPGEPGFGCARFATGTQALAIRLIPPDTKPIEDLDPLCAGALRRFIRAQSQVPGLPVEVSLRSVTRIVPHGDPVAVRALVRSLVTQIALLHSPADVRISVCAPADRLSYWEWVKWLPHTMHPTEQDAAGPVRLMSPSLGGLEPMLQLRDRPRFSPAAASAPGSLPLHVVVADGVAREPGVELDGIDGVVIIEIGEAIGADEVIGNFGSGGTCGAGVSAGEAGTLTLRVTGDAVYRVPADGSAEAFTGVPDRLSLVEAEAVARQLAPLRPAGVVAAAGDALGATTTLTALLGVGGPPALDVGALRRGRAPRDRLRVPIGHDADGQPVQLDLKESAEGGMGPHGLVVGATGSGKSELLRTLVLGLALTHSAQDLNFVLVDFKGGATFGGLDRLPHTSAVITNLADELPLVDRMRDALQGEIVRRQELLRAAGNYASLRDYAAAQAQRPRGAAELLPVPSLFVVLDEFSELLAAKPELIDLFVMIGRVGRSLGVHLLLASQRLEEGRLRGLDTQLSYRIGLRTFSPQESRIVLGVPDAYELPSQPGSAYLKDGTGELIRFKAAYVSGPLAGAGAAAGGRAAAGGGLGPGLTPAPRLKPRIVRFGPGYVAPRYEETPAAGELVNKINDADGVSRADGFGEAAAVAGREATGAGAFGLGVAGRERSRTLLDATVELLSGPGPVAHQIWLPPLSEPPALDQLLNQADPWRGDPASLPAVLGIVDRPFEQRRDPLWVDLAAGAGHVAVAGGPRSGKSTVLASLISSLALIHTPAQAQFYVLDFGGGTLTTLAGLPHVGGVASRLQGDRVRRTVAEVRAVLERRERQFGQLGIDSIATYRALRAEGAIPGDGLGDVFLVVDGWLTLRQDYEELEQAVTALAARGLGYGIHLVAATNKWSEFRPAVRDLFGTRLELRLGDPYESEIGRGAARNVPAGAPGRGLTQDGLHFLAAMPRVDGRASAAGLPEAVRDLVGRVAAAWDGDGAPPVRMLPDVLAAAALPAPGSSGARVPFGLDENELAPVFLDFAADPHFLVLGDTECGKSNLLRLTVAGIVTRYTPDQAKIIFLDYRRSLLDAAQVPHQIGYATSSVAATALLDEVRQVLSTRLPPPDLSPAQLRSRSWWRGSDLFIVADDYDLVAGAAGPAGAAGAANPLLALAEFLPQARDVGLHVVLARSAGGAGRAMFDPVVQRLREMGSPGLIMSGNKDEGALLGGVRPSALPCGRGVLVTRRGESRLVQVALAEEVGAKAEVGAEAAESDAEGTGQSPVIA